MNWTWQEEVVGAWPREGSACRKTDQYPSFLPQLDPQATVFIPFLLMDNNRKITQKFQVSKEGFGG